MPIHINDNNIWKEISQPYVNDNGVWKLPSEIYANDNGIWKKVWSSGGSGAEIGGSGYFVFGNIIEELVFASESIISTTGSFAEYQSCGTACNSTTNGYTGMNNYGDHNTIHKITFSNKNVSVLSSKLLINFHDGGACNSSSIGYFSRGAINKLIFITETVASMSAVTSYASYGLAGCNSSINGYFSRGYNYSMIDKLIFAQETSSRLSSNLTKLSRQGTASCNSSTYGYFGGGNDADYICDESIDKLNFSNDIVSRMSSLLSTSKYAFAACNSSINGYFGGGCGSYYYSTIDKLAFTSESISLLSSKLSQLKCSLAACQVGDFY